MNELRIFENPKFGSVRTINENGKTLFCGSDVAKALGYAKPQNAIERHCRCTLKRGIPHPQAPDKEIEMLFIPEGDIYRLAAKSELPGAEEFESWIFDEVLPSIQKNGVYMTPDVIDKILSDPDTIIRLATELKEERNKRLALETENEIQKQQIADFQPIRQYVDEILSSTGTVVMTQIAADYGLSARALNKILHEEGIQRNVNGQWILYKEHMGKGYTSSRTVQITRSDGTPDTKINTVWTQKGRLMIHKILQSKGIEAVMDRKTSA